MEGSTVSWESQKQRPIALSSTEAEYISLSEATKKAVYLRRLLVKLDFEDTAKTQICTDNERNNVQKMNVYHSRTKHIDISFY